MLGAMSSLRAAAILSFGLATLVTGCNRNQTPQPQYGQYGQYGQYQQYPPGYGPQQYPPGYGPQQYPPGYGPQQPQPNAPAPTVQTNPAQKPASPADQPVMGPQPNDPITLVDLTWLRAQAGSVMGELIVGLRRPVSRRCRASRSSPTRRPAR